MSYEEQRLNGALQENILTLLCFNDSVCKQIRAAVTPQLFESSVFREIAGHACDFIDQFGEAIKDHLPDQLEGILKGEDRRKASSYEKLLTNLFDARSSVNADYAMRELHKFVRLQNLKNAFVLAAKDLDDGRIDEVEVRLQQALAHQVVAFDAGLNLSDEKQMSLVLHELEEPGVLTGIHELDKNGIIPRRKEQMVFVAPRGRGKSWFCTHIAKMALLQRWSVLVVTLEMSEKRYASRFIQSFFSISKREAKTRVAELVKDRRGNLQDILYEEIERQTLQDPGIDKIIHTRIKREFRRRQPLVIKQFPTQQLTPEMLEAYLDGLQRFHNVVPDLIIIDYPHLMKHDAKNKRVELGIINEKLRGIAVARNAANVIVAQGNRESESAKTVRGDMLAEDISALATADVTLTYSQTEMEKKLGLARIFVEKARNDVDKYMLLITQAYGIGQFALDSAPLSDDYWKMLSGQERDEDEDDEEDEPQPRTPPNRSRERQAGRGRGRKHASE